MDVSSAPRTCVSCKTPEGGWLDYVDASGKTHLAIRCGACVEFAEKQTLALIKTMGNLAKPSHPTALLRTSTILIGHDGKVHRYVDEDHVWTLSGWGWLSTPCDNLEKYVVPRK